MRRSRGALLLPFPPRSAQGPPAKAARRDETWILRAERRHRAVVCADAAVAHIHVVVMQVLRRGKGREHQLALEAQVVQRAFRSAASNAPGAFHPLAP